MKVLSWVKQDKMCNYPIINYEIQMRRNLKRFQFKKEVRRRIAEAPQKSKPFPTLNQRFNFFQFPKWKRKSGSISWRKHNMREFNPGLHSAQIIAYLLQGKSAREIGRTMRYKSTATSQKKIDRLAKHGYLIKHAGPDHPGISITLLGYTLLETLRQSGSTIVNDLTQSHNMEAPTEKKGKYFRLHALQIKYWYLSPLPPENIHLIQFQDHPTKLRNLRNHVDQIVEFKDFNVTATTRALKFTDIEVRLPYEEVEDPEIHLEKARDIIAPEVENIERVLQKHITGLKLRRLAGGVLDGNVVRGEIALESDEIALNVGEIQKNSEEKFRIYDRNDGKLSAIVNASKGPWESETVHPQTFVEK